MRIVEIKVYQYSELSEKAKQKAIEKLYDINVDFEWWDFVYEDAVNIGIKIEEFDISRGNRICASTLIPTKEIVESIFKNNGEKSDTYVLAEEFYKIKEPSDEEEDNFLYSLQEEYLHMLRKNYEYFVSEEAIVETIEANEYEFTEDGNMF